MRLSADTNVFVYAMDDRDRAKRATADRLQDLLAAAGHPIGLQVVGEYQNVLRRQLKMSPALAIQAAQKLKAAFPTFGYDANAVDLALAHAATGRVSYWDALLLVSCARAGVEVLLSEDMQDGATIAGVRVVNPFSKPGLSPAARELLDL